jgi:hypothetical protein
MNFQDAIVEYRYFDHNMKAVERQDQAATMIGRTDCNHFGKDRWYAIDVRHHWNLGDGTLAEAIRRAATQAITDEAAKAEIKFVDEGFGIDVHRKNWGVIVNGERVGYFSPRVYRTGYFFVDRSDRGLYINIGHRCEHMEVDTKSGFKDAVRRWMEIIPTAADIEARIQAERDRMAREEAEQAEADRIATIKEAGVDTLEALKALADGLDAYHKSRGIDRNDFEQRIRNYWLPNARAAIAKAEGRNHD